MYIKQIYTNCLSQASYYIESGDECVIIDPLRDIDDYKTLINKHDVLSMQLENLQRENQLLTNDKRYIEKPV